MSSCTRLLQRDHRRKSRPKIVHRRGGVTKNSPAIWNAAEDDPCSNGKPAANSAFENPRWCQYRCGNWKERSTEFAPASNLCRDDNRRGSDWEENPHALERGENCEWKYCELPCKSRGSGDLIVSLAHALRPEMARGGRAPHDVYVLPDGLGSTACDHSADKLEILEHGVAVVSIGAPECRSADTKCAGPVA